KVSDAKGKRHAGGNKQKHGNEELCQVQAALRDRTINITSCQTPPFNGTHTYVCCHGDLLLINQWLKRNRMFCFLSWVVGVYPPPHDFARFERYKSVFEQINSAGFQGGVVVLIPVDAFRGACFVPSADRDQFAIPADRHRTSEFVKGFGVRSFEVVLLGPGC